MRNVFLHTPCLQTCHHIGYCAKTSSVILQDNRRRVQKDKTEFKLRALTRMLIKQATFVIIYHFYFQTISLFSCYLFTDGLRKCKRSSGSIHRAQETSSVPAY